MRMKEKLKYTTTIIAASVIVTTFKFTLNSKINEIIVRRSKWYTISYRVVRLVNGNAVIYN